MNSFKLFWKAFYLGMKKFGSTIVDIINFILLLPVYYIGIGISSIMAKILGKHFMDLSKPSKKVKSYWLDKKQKEIKIDDFYNEF